MPHLDDENPGHWTSVGNGRSNHLETHYPTPDDHARKIVKDAERFNKLLAMVVDMIALPNAESPLHEITITDKVFPGRSSHMDEKRAKLISMIDAA